MRKLEWPTPFRDVQYLVCEAIRSEEAENLFLLLAEHHVEEPEREFSVGEVKISGKPIVRTANSRRWFVYWKRVAAFKSSSESYYFSIYQIDGAKGVSSFKVADSVWLKEMRDEGLLGHMQPDCQHFVICTDHKILEVLATDEPEIKEYRKGQIVIDVLHSLRGKFLQKLGFKYSVGQS